MASDRNTQKQLWSDRKFIDWLETVKAKKLLEKNPVNNLGQLTKQMLECPSIKQLEKELVGAREFKDQIRIRLDRKKI